MYKRPFFRFLVFMFLLFSQVYVYATEPVPALDTAKDRVYKLVDSGKPFESAAAVDKLITDNSGNSSLPKVISDIADYRAKKYDYTGAKALYNRLIQLYPEDNYSKQASLKILKTDIFAKIENGNLSSAGSDVEQLITNHSVTPYFSETIYDIAVRYSKRRYFDNAAVLFQRMIEICPADSFTDKARLEQAKNDIASKFETGNFTAVDGMIQSTAGNYSGHKHLPEVIYFSADKYEENYDYTKAKAIYNQVIQISPDSSYGSNSRLESLKIDIYEKIDGGDFTSVDDLVEKLIAKYPKHSYLPEVLYNIAGYYTKCSNYGRAQKLYSRLISLYPEDTFSSRADVEIALLNIRSKIAMGLFKLSELEQLRSKYEKDAFLARRFYELGYYCLDNNNNAAISILGLVCKQFSDSSFYHGRAKITYDTAKIYKEIEAGNLTEAQAAVAKLKRDYAGYYYLPGQLYFIAKAYSNHGYRDQSYMLCNELIKMDESKYAVYGNIQKCRLDINSRLQADDLAGAKQLFNEFKSNYAGSLYLDEGVLNFVQEFYERGLSAEGEASKDYLSEAIRMCLSENLSGAKTDFIRVQGCILLGESYLRLGDYAQSADYYQRLVDQYPDSRYAWHAQFMVGQAYENMIKAGQISKSEGYPLIRAAYSNVLKKYPYCKAAPAARTLLGNGLN